MTQTNTTERVTTALIGCGNRGVNALGKAIKGSTQLSLTAVCDVDEQRAAAASDMLGAPAETDHRRLLADPKLQSVVVATSAKWHVPVALDAVRAGKHVFVEKPLADSYGAARQLADAAEAAGVIGMMGYQLRFSAFSKQLKEEVAAIEPVQALLSRQRGPFRQQFFFPGHFGGIMDHLTHDIHLSLWLMGGAPRAVFGTTHGGTIMGDETIEFVSVVVELDGGRTITIAGSMHGVQTPNVVQVVGRRGSVTTFDRKTLRVVHHGGIVEPAPALPAGLESHTIEAGGDSDATPAMLDHFADLVAGRTKEQRGATLREGAYAVAITQAAVESARSGRKVMLDELG